MAQADGFVRLLKIWLLEMRVPFFTAVVVPTVLGAVFAWYDADAFDAWLFVATMGGLVFLHAGANVVNDYFDFRNGTDRVNRNRSPFNGGSPFILDGILTPRQVYKAALAFFAVGSIIGIYLAIEVSYLVLLLGVAGVATAFFYTSPRVNLARRGVGEVALGLAFGPLIVSGTYLVQTGEITFASFLIGLPVGILIGLVLFVNQFPDMEADRVAGKTHWVVRMGLHKASYWYAGLMVATFSTILALWALELYPPLVLLGLVPALVAVKASRIVLEKHPTVRELLPAQAMTIQVHLMVGLLLSAGFLLSGLL
jgi:1,4-dihydroxy-2-naphthoate octaprenyltransferase